ncbi:hypothetical protein K3495_g5782 [Podosphaera aphanis]|nr:hypothetical protein K3495_g5782 [Podosphaera aphanis]
MPPRKKSKAPVAVDSNAATDEETVILGSRSKSAKPDYDILKDPWTDEQETSLFKGIVKWKPAGMHRHFRMIAISEHLRNHGYDPTVEKHTRIPGIWEKLKTLYNLEAIDYNESNIDYAKPDEKADVFLEFKLPEEEYDEIQFMRGKRNSSEASSGPISPLTSPPPAERSPSPSRGKKRKRKETLAKQRASTVDETDVVPRSSPAISTSSKPARRGRPPGRPKKGRVESSPRPPSVITDGQDETEGANEDAEDTRNITSAKGKGTKAKPDQTTRKRRNKNARS